MVVVSFDSSIITVKPVIFTALFGHLEWIVQSPYAVLIRLGLLAQYSLGFLVLLYLKFNTKIIAFIRHCVIHYSKTTVVGLEKIKH